MPPRGFWGSLRETEAEQCGDNGALRGLLARTEGVLTEAARAYLSSYPH